jgi:hypothetical protein
MLRLWERRRAAPKVRPQLPCRLVKVTEQETRARNRRNDTDGAARRLRQTVEDNRLL